MKIKDKKTRKLIQALETNGFDVRYSGSHCVVNSPVMSNAVTLSTKSYHLDKQIGDLKRAGVNESFLNQLGIK